MQLDPGTIVGGRYVVEGLLGQGGMAVVYRVRHRTLGTAHALKLVTAPSASARERLLREGRLQGTLVHPNVVTVTDQLEIASIPALVLEFVDGPSLAQLVGTNLSIEQLDGLGAGILAGVAAAHQAGLVHRDLKPANVLLAVENGRAVPKVTDFGLAVDPHGERSTRTGASLGTPEYMAPEQVRSAKDVDARADVWGLGVLLYELCSGRLPFQDEDRFALFEKITSGRHVPLLELRPELPERMVQAVEAALSVDRDQRPAHAGALRLRWSPETSEARVDDLAVRVLMLAPSASSNRDATPLPTRAPQAATWAPPPLTFAERPQPPSSDPLPQPPSALPPGTPPDLRPMLLAGLLTLLFGVVLLAVLLAVVVGVLLWDAPAQGVAVVDPPPVALPSPLPPGDLEPPEPTGFARPTKAITAMTDAAFLTVVDEGSFFLAVDPEAPLLVATGSEALGESYTAREEITKAARAGGPESPGEVLAALLAGRAQPLDAYVAGHPGDVSMHLWHLWALCPGARCGEAQSDVALLRAEWDGRGVVRYAEARVARDLGDFDAAGAALDAWTRESPGEPVAILERAHLALARGDAAAVPALLKSLPEDFARRTVWVDVLTASSALRLGDEVAFEGAMKQYAEMSAARRFEFARSMAPVLVAVGRRNEADQLLDNAIATPYQSDDIAGVFHAELTLLRAGLAVGSGDRTVVESCADELSELAMTKDGFGWRRERLSHLNLVGEGLRLVSRGNLDSANRRYDELAAQNPDSADLRVLARALGR